MNHSIPGVNAGYVTRHKLLEDHLRSQQQAISTAVFSAIGKMLTKDAALRDWLGRCASRVTGGHQMKRGDLGEAQDRIRRAA
jgi:hypothetical protein